MVKAEAQKRGLSNVRTAYAKAEAMPFEDASIDLVSCRIAPHHFESIPDFLGEVHRVLKPNGLFALVDNVVPDGSVGDYINAFERFRDPSHRRAWTMLHGRVVRPPAIGAKLEKVDDSAARKIPGVARVVREGDFLGVVATSEWDAIRGADALKVTWSKSETLPDQAKLWEHEEA